MFEMRKTAPADIPSVLEMYDSARVWLRESGVDQWQEDYPNRASLTADILRGEGYVYIEDGETLGTLALTFGGDKYFDTLTGGEWPNGEKYATVHRMAVKTRRRGAASRMLEAADMLCRMRGVMNMRTDTHRDNAAMRELLAKQGFVPAGTVTLPDRRRDPERVAYFKILTDGCKCCHADT